jgi:hypothetical protein
MGAVRTTVNNFQIKSSRVELYQSLTVWGNDSQMAKFRHMDSPSSKSLFL